MVESQSLTETEAERFKLYRLLLLTSIVLNLLVGVFILIWPDAFTSLLNQPTAFPKTWPRHWGAQLIAINLLYLPGYWHPRENRWPNWLGIVIRLSFAVFFFSQGDGFIWMGLYDGAFGLALLIIYSRAVRAGSVVNSERG
jgi:hypothetical protein